jgi:hypothetical protein
MNNRSTNHDDSDSRAYLHHTVLDNGDALVDFVDESTGEVITETIAGYMPPVPARAPAESWSDYWDLYTWELSDPTEVAELTAAAIEAECDRRDAPRLDGEDLWREMMSAGHQASQVSDDELAQLAAHGCI